MNGMEFRVMLGAVVFAILVGLASLRAQSMETAEEPVVAGETSTPVELKKRLLDEADLLKVHHEVYHQVGEKDWEARVKPAFLKDLALAAGRENGTLLPGIDEILDWVRAHPDEARALLRSHATPPSTP